MPPPKKPNASQVNVILGSDEARVKETALMLVRSLTPPDAGDFSNDIIDGTADNSEHAGTICSNVCMALQTLPFFGGSKVVWLKNANFLGESGAGRGQDAVNGFERIIDVIERGLGSDVRVVISTTSIDKRRSAYKRISKIANIEVFDKPDTSRAGWEGPVIAMASQKARDMGITFESGALELLVQMAGDDTRQMENELEKIDLYLGERRRAGLKTVQNMVSMSRAGVLWDLGNAIGKRDLPRALELLGTLLYQGQNAIGLLLAAIVPRVRSLLLIKDLGSRHKLNKMNYNGFCASLEALPSTATSHLPRKKDGTGFNAYPMFLALPEAGNYTLEELHAGFKACLAANAKLVTSSLDPKLVLERLLIGLLSKPAR
ncbi:DNA polymerase III subunit delta [Prosthecobacter vanneervenii]|uniref:DNA polymerase-3 subunit delta n=1 Tax=Prosthecobacter vanneervenii TaxID=48466 RepID=A0A7W7YEB4_9BACT|nr:DNA polymerase III subunit delta [Prosthecobacter vanneervenii]MBB5034603.1 DNA polymerase-3 subunit delta [Prosthecobacter vanneervenii]